MTDINALNDEILENVSGGNCESYHRVTGTSSDGSQTVYFGMDTCSCCGQIKTGSFYQINGTDKKAVCEDCFRNGKLPGWDSSKMSFAM